MTTVIRRTGVPEHLEVILLRLLELRVKLLRDLLVCPALKRQSFASIVEADVDVGDDFDAALDSGDDGGDQRASVERRRLTALDPSVGRRTSEEKSAHEDSLLGILQARQPRDVLAVVRVAMTRPTVRRSVDHRDRKLVVRSVEKVREKFSVGGGLLVGRGGVLVPGVCAKELAMRNEVKGETY